MREAWVPPNLPPSAHGLGGGQQRRYIPADREDEKEMKKRICALTALLLAACLLCGCGQQAGFGSAGFSREERAPLAAEGEFYPPAFEDISYERPVPGRLMACALELELALENGCGLNGAMDILDRCYQEYYNFHTMSSLANIRNCMNVQDEYYAGEYAWCLTKQPEIQKIIEDIYYLCGGSSIAELLEKYYFWPGFAQEYAQRGQGSLNDHVVELMTREGELIAEYRELMAGLLEAEEELSQYYQQDGSYEDLILAHYEQHYQPMAEIYIELVSVRQEQARTLGFGSYEEMQYYYYFERDYSPEQAAAYVQDIKEILVPLYVRVMAEDPYKEIEYCSLSSQRLLELVGSGAQAIGGEADNAFSFMLDGGYYDVELRSGKAELSFQSYLTDYEAPFLFLSAYGYIDDVLILAHEFGHYADAYVNYDAYETIDLSECFSQAMEYLILSNCQGLSQAERDSLYQIKMLDTLETYVYQASYAEFEHIVYGMDPEELSADVLGRLFLQLAIDYGYYDGVNQSYHAMSWVEITHFFEMPFYVISYPVSNDVAMQIYELESQQPGQGAAKYLEMLPRQYSSLMESIELWALKSPFSPGRIEKVYQTLTNSFHTSGMTA